MAKLCGIVVALGSLLAGAFWPALNAEMPQHVPNAEANRLNEVLRCWHQALTGIESALCEVNRTERDAGFDKTEVYIGFFQYRKPVCWTLEMRKQERPNELSEKFVANDRALYQFVPSCKEVKRYERPKDVPPLMAPPTPTMKVERKKADGKIETVEVPVPPILDFFGLFSVPLDFPLFFGMSPADAKNRYDWKLTKEDDFYIYLDVTPRLKEERAIFQRARLVLNKDTFLPRQIWFQESGPRGDLGHPKTRNRGETEETGLRASHSEGLDRNGDPGVRV